MAEKIHDASRNLPKSMLSAVSLNCRLGFLVAMTLIFCVGDAEAALAGADNYNGYAFLGIFMHNIGNRHALNMMVFLVIFGLTNCAISETAVTTHFSWSEYSSSRSTGTIHHHRSPVYHQYRVERRSKRNQLPCWSLRALQLPKTPTTAQFTI